MFRNDRSPGQPWDSPETVASALTHARTRQARWPIADPATTTRLAGGAAHWQRALAMFPQAMAGRLKTLPAATTHGRLDSTTKAWIAWAAAREDRAWYALDLALRQLQALGIHPETQEPRSTLPAIPRT